MLKYQVQINNNIDIFCRETKKQEADATKQNTNRYSNQFKLIILIVIL